MRYRLRFGLVGLLLFALGVVVGTRWGDFFDSLVHGPAIPMIATSDIDIAPDENCVRQNLGGIKRGLPVLVRREGPVNWVSARFVVVDPKPGFVEISLEEAERLDRSLRCATK